MKYLLFITVGFFLACTPLKTVPLSGNYPSTPMIFNSDKSFDKTWDNLIDVFAQKGLSIKVIDRSSGLIVSGRAVLSATMEDKSGKPVNPNAYVAVPSYISGGKRYPATVSPAFIGPYASEQQIAALNAAPVYGEWNVRIKADGNGGSTINVNILNLTYMAYNSTLKTQVESALYTFKSTGVFEKELADLIR